VTQPKGFYTVTSDIQGPNSRMSQWQMINTTTWRGRRSTRGDLR
jgi:hypothetical protein